MSKDYNYVKKLFMQKCSVTDVSIVIETAFEAVLPTLYNLSEYTCGDIMKMRGGHTWGAAGGAFKALGVTKRRSGVRRFGHCGRRLGAKGAGANAFGPGVIDGFKFIYEISGLAFAEGALFKFFLFEVGKDFLINWMTLAYAAEKCELPPAGTFWTGWDALFTGGPDHEVTCFIGPGRCPCAQSGGHEIYVNAGCVASISWSGRWVPFRDDPANVGPVTMWIEDEDGRKFDEVTSPVRTGQNYINQAGGVYNLPGRSPAGTTYRLKAIIHSGLMGPASDPPPTVCVNTSGRPINFMPLAGCGKALGRASDEMWGWLDQPHLKNDIGERILNPWFKDLGNFIHGKPPDPLV